jgi:hypothetical protein
MNQPSWLGYPIWGCEFKTLLKRHGARVIYDIDERHLEADLTLAGFKLFFNRKDECCSILILGERSAGSTFDKKNPDRVKLLSEIAFWTSKKSVKAFADRCEREVLEDCFRDSSGESSKMTISFEDYKYHYVFTGDALSYVHVCFSSLESDEEITAFRHLKLSDAIHGMTLCKFFELFCREVDDYYDLNEKFLWEINQKSLRELNRFISITFYLYKHNYPNPSHRVNLQKLHRYLRWARGWDDEIAKGVIERIQAGYDLLQLQDVIDIEQELKQMPL